MTIKKTMKVRPTGSPAAATGAGGNGAVADRFKLDLTDPNAKKAPAGKATVYAVVAACLALIAAGVLTYTLWQHWEFLMPA